ncbi:hypothetical protein [Streptomyces caatingaensis]|uniref:Lipoprotein n=1 Tax=Streptomyces caatingaensis TaxID=1678637 RepID=A0A0K9XG06_9ACTN|nr:hypothetical protein [Streptomyces caatingaensis]KNB52310.1 hypothetical protein AC230_12250 [Streptomyces caatingaensis]
MSAPRTLLHLAAATLALAMTTAGSTHAAGPARDRSGEGHPSTAPYEADGLQGTVHSTDFAQLSSAQDQVQDGTVKTVRLEQDDAHHGVKVTDDSVTVEHAGTYLIVVAPQVLTDKGGVQQGNDPTDGCVDTWFTINGQALPNSGVRLCQAVTHSTHVVVSQSAVPLKAGDTVQVRSKGRNVRFNAVQPSEGPLIPSVILTLTRL